MLYTNPKVRLKRMEVGANHKGEVWTDVLGWYKDEITIGEEGWADFRCPAHSVSIWTKKDARGREEFTK
jgi:alpha-amylase